MDNRAKIPLMYHIWYSLSKEQMLWLYKNNPRRYNDIKARVERDQWHLVWDSTNPLIYDIVWTKKVATSFCNFHNITDAAQQSPLKRKDVMCWFIKRKPTVVYDHGGPILATVSIFHDGPQGPYQDLIVDFWPGGV